MQISWFAIMAVLFTAVAAKSTATTTTAAATSAKESSSSASTKPTKNAAAGNALNNPFAFLRELHGGVDGNGCYLRRKRGING
ncbi:hypothetical protein ABOM_006331 [Aspergillus bombycis]|uniref:Uncharacterized protein n=1 Tax=Aspergillus bombycis TaxID=109264 RepID=A0A1F8A1Z0_9EURO|nr:hypothetical protein ABOM_006331 [Aspergillus bombycis]OGM45439.1 hypothetical protein ABOM_006331 [Aspergillus bombycis]